MLNRITNDVKKTGGKLLWFDPNLTKDVPVDLSQLTLSVDLEVTSKSRSIINSQTVVNTGSQTSKTISFFDGTLNQGKNKNEYTRTLTTNYTNIQHLHTTLNDEYEALGIESINITFNTSYAPTVKIRFIDIRGAAMFSNGGQNDYKFFFELPYPLFNLTIKGYYGKTVRYCLHLLRFNASFNSQTGNFEIDCDFIGFTYALLADMLMGLVRASVTTTRGKEVFESIKSEYKDKNAIVTIDELVKRISDVQEVVDKVKQGEETQRASASSALKLKIEEIKTRLLIYLDTYAIGLTKLTRSEVDGVLVCTVPTVDQQKIIETENGKYVIDVKKIVNDEISKLVDFTKTDADTLSLVDALGPDPDNSPKLIGYSRVDSLDVSIISNETKLRKELKNNSFKSDKIDYLVELLPNLNYNGVTHVRVVDYSSAIKACDKALIAANNFNANAINKTTDELKNSIKDVLGFDPTIRNLFRVLCISTEVFLQCMLNVSKDADEDSNGKRAAALKPLSAGLNTPKGATKIFPWPEYRKEGVKNDGEYEEWMGNQIPTNNVPELLFTEELLEQMILQFKQDKLRESENDNIYSWWPISVIDTPVNDGVRPQMVENPYKVGLTDELEGVQTPKCTADEALRVMMYRAFLLLGVVNRNSISNTMLSMHAKLEAENLFSVLKQMPDLAIAKTIKSKIVGTTPQTIYDRFLNGTDLDVSGPANSPSNPKPFFIFSASTNTVEYRYIWHKQSNRSYIPINGRFNSFSFQKSRNVLREPEQISGLTTSTIFVSNVTNHVRIDKATSTNGYVGALVGSSIDNNNGVKNAKDRSNYIFYDGSISCRILSDEEYNAASLAPDFGQTSMATYSPYPVVKHNLISDYIKDSSQNAAYQNPLKSGRYNANTYDKLDYEEGGDYEDYNTLGDNFTGVYPDKPGGIASSFVAFFNEPSTYSAHKYNVGANDFNYPFTTIVHTGFATDYNSSMDKYSWYTSNDKNFKALNSVQRPAGYHPDLKDVGFYPYTRMLPYGVYGKNRQIISINHNTGKDFYVPRIDYCVDTDYSYSLFGTPFYYYQNRTDIAIKKNEFYGILNDSVATVGNASRAFLFLHCFPFQGVTKKGETESDLKQVWDYFMFDYNNDSDSHNETVETNTDGEDPMVLGIKGLFRLHNAFIEAPRIWTLFIGAILWRIEKFKEDNSNDPIEWVKSDGTTIIPGMKYQGEPRIDEFLSVVLGKSNYIPSGIHFNGIEDTDYPLGYTVNSKITDVGSYSRVDETIMGLPTQVKSEFITKFLDWVATDFAEIQNDLEIKFYYDPTKIRENLRPHPEYIYGYTGKWNALNNEYIITSPLSSDGLSLPIEKIKTIFLNADGTNNIYDNYSMVAPVSNKNPLMRNLYNKFNMTTDEYNKYVNGEFSYSMTLKHDGPAMLKIVNLVKSKVFIQNVRPSIWNPPVYKDDFNSSPDNKVKRKQFEPITVKKVDLDTFISAFYTQFVIISADLDKSAEDEENRIQQELFKSMDDDKIKLNIYRTLMSIYQKWISGIKGEMFTQCSVNDTDKNIAMLERNVDPSRPSNRLIDSFRFLDRSFNDIGDDFYINPQIFYNMILDNRNASFFDIANKILSDNNFNFIPLPTFVNFNDVNVLSDIFEPYPYNDIVLTGPSFVCVYAGQSSTNLDLGSKSIYEDDGIFIRTDANGDIVTATVPPDILNSKPPTAYETKLPIFTVNYGQQNQNYFKDIKLDQSEFSETAESLEIMDDIAQGGDKRKSVMVGQNLFNTYQKRSYSCEVEMLGCALIQPMMYFQLNNIPMFRGLYLIINVTHTIRPNSMTTTFKGVRVKKTKTPLLTASDVLMTLIGDVNNVNNNGTTVNSGSCPQVVLDTTTTKTKEEVANLLSTNNIGLSKNVIYGIMGNLKAESGFVPGVYNSGGGGCGAYGLAQWRGPRQKELDKFATNSNTQTNNSDTQIKFLMKELKSRTELLAALKTTNISIETAARLWYLDFELTNNTNIVIDNYTTEAKVNALIDSKSYYDNASKSNLKERVNFALGFNNLL